MMKPLAKSTDIQSIGKNYSTALTDVCNNYRCIVLPICGRIVRWLHRCLSTIIYDSHYESIGEDLKLMLYCDMLAAGGEVRYVHWGYMLRLEECYLSRSQLVSFILPIDNQYCDLKQLLLNSCFLVYSIHLCKLQHISLSISNRSTDIVCVELSPTSIVNSKSCYIGDLLFGVMFVCERDILLWMIVVNDLKVARL